MTPKSTTPKQRLMIIDSAPARSGKSTVLQVLRNFLLDQMKGGNQKYYYQGKKDDDNIEDAKLKKDVIFLLQFTKDVVIAISPAGDSPEHLMKGYKRVGELLKGKCADFCTRSDTSEKRLPDIYITASRPCEHLHKILKSYAKEDGYQQVIKSHECWPGGDKYIADANNRYAQEVISIIIKFMKENHMK